MTRDSNTRIVFNQKNRTSFIPVNKINLHHDIEVGILKHRYKI